MFRNHYQVVCKVNKRFFIQNCVLPPISLQFSRCSSSVWSRIEKALCWTIGWSSLSFCCGKRVSTICSKSGEHTIRWLLTESIWFQYQIYFLCLPDADHKTAEVRQFRIHFHLSKNFGIGNISFLENNCYFCTDLFQFFLFNFIHLTFAALFSGSAFIGKDVFSLRLTDIVPNPFPRIFT